MADIIVELDQQDHLEFDLKQEDQRDIDLKEIKAVVIGGIKYEEDPVDSGFVKYNAETDKYTTITPESTVTEDSENIVTSKAIYDYVETHVDAKIADLVNSAPEMLDTLGEVAKAIQENETVIDALNSAIEYKQDKLIAGENITIDENNVISATGGLNIADLPKFTNKINIKMSVMPSLNGTITLPIVSSSNFVVDWGDGTTTDYVDATTEINHTYSDINFQGWIYIYGDWKGIQFTSTSDNNKSVIIKAYYDNNISSIGVSAFSECTNLNEIIIKNESCIISSYSFKNTRLNTLSLPKNLSYLSSYAFQGMKYLRNVDFPNSTTNIDSYAFSGSYYLTELIIPDYVTTIGTYAFGNPQRLRYVQIGKTVYSSITSIGSKAFYSPNSRIERVVIKTLNTPSISSDTFADNVKTFLVNYSKLKAFKTATNWTNFADKIYPEGGNYSETITIPSTSWDTTTNTVTVEAVGSTSEDRNIITWNVSSGGVQVENTYGLKCTAQGTMSLTFSCETIPTEDVEVSVRYMLTNY